MTNGPRRRGNADRGPDHEERALPMADNHPTGPTPTERPLTAALDARDQAGVLRHVLSLHPQVLTFDELARELTAGATCFAERDRIERAVRDLVAGGLLHRDGEWVLPTRAAVLFYELEEA